MGRNGALRPGGLLLFALAGAIQALPAAASADAERPVETSPDTAAPWGAEAPGGVGAPVALGFDWLSDRQLSLRIDAARTVTTARDLASGASQTLALDGDPALLNRKFALGWNLHAAGAQVPVALPRPPLAARLGITPTLVLEAASADLNLAFHDLPEPPASTSLAGRGLQLGAALTLVAPLCSRCRWFAGAGYRYRFVPRTGVERGQPVAAPGFRVAASAVQLRRDTGEVDLRLGYGGRGDRLAVYAGVLRRQAHVTVLDDLTLVQDSLRQETRLVSRTSFGSVATLAAAGLDAHLWGPLFARAQVTFGGGDRTMLGKVVLEVPRLWGAEATGAGRPPGAATPGGGAAPGMPREASTEQIRRRARQIAARLAPLLAAIRDRFAAQAARLGEMPAPPAAALARLLDETESALLAALREPELAALRDSVRHLFAAARSALGIEAAAGAAAAPSPDAPHAVRAALRRAERVAAEPRLVRQQRTVGAAAARNWLGRIGAALDRLVRRTSNDALLVDLCIKTKTSAATGEIPRTEFKMHPESDPPAERTIKTDDRMLNVWFGRYVYGDNPYGAFKPIPGVLDLLDDPRPIVVCTLVPASSGQRAEICGQRDAPVDRECPSP